MVIGIPRALYDYYYHPLWAGIFESLGMKVISSPPTNQQILQAGVKVCPAELCVPIKIFCGHVAELMDRSDYVFVPRLVSMHNREWFCPKFLGLPDLVRHTVPGAMKKVLSPDIRTDGTDHGFTVKSLMEIAGPLGVAKNEMKKALAAGTAAFGRFRELCEAGHTLDEAALLLKGRAPKASLESPELTLGIIGYVYNIYDSAISMDILKRLRAMNVKPITFETLGEEVLQNPRQPGKKIFWTFTRKTYNAAKIMMERPDLDGLIHVTAFGCGPDSVMGKMLEMDCETAGMPFMTIRVDEHSGENHLQTRMEAFVDMLIRKKRRTRSVI